MTHNVSIFKELDKSLYSKVTMGNVDHVNVKGKGVIAMETPSGIKYILDANLENKVDYYSLLRQPGELLKSYSSYTLMCVV